MLPPLISFETEVIRTIPTSPRKRMQVGILASSLVLCNSGIAREEARQSRSALLTSNSQRGGRDADAEAA